MNIIIKRYPKNSMVACNDPQKRGKESFYSTGCKKQNPG